VLTLLVVVAPWPAAERRLLRSRTTLAMAAPLALWVLWCVLSYAWSAQPPFTLRELKREIVDGMLGFAAFFLIAQDDRALRRLALTALAATAALALVAIGMEWATGAFDPARLHHGHGTYSTHLVLIAPFALLFWLPPPAGFANGARAQVAFWIFAILVLAAARLTENRMVWLALIVEVVVVTLTAALRWSHLFEGRRLRFATLTVAIVAVLAATFVVVAREKAAFLSPAHPSVAQTFADDPRLPLWNRTFERIRERPWTGHGFGRRIIGEELASALNDPLLTHAHNIFASQWLQTGAVGLALLLATLGAMAWRYSRFVRSPDDTLSVVGLIGLALLAGLIVKNLTDDFLYRSNGREFWALAALLLGFGLRRELRRDGSEASG
jgi:O-antigen ligase